jgi:hypothetical protein
MYTAVKVKNIVEDKRTIEEKVASLNKFGVNVEVIQSLQNKTSIANSLNVILGKVPVMSKLKI